MMKLRRFACTFLLVCTLVCLLALSASALTYDDTLPAPVKVTLSATKVTAPAEIDITVEMDTQNDEACYASLCFYNSKSAKYIWFDLAPAEGKLWQGTTKVPYYSEGGTFSLCSVQIYSDGDDYREFSIPSQASEGAESLSESLQKKTITVTPTNPDTTAPKNFKASLSKSAVMPGESVEIIAEATDDISGFECAILSFYEKNNDAYLAFVPTRVDYLADGYGETLFADGKAHETFEIPQNQATGVYRLYDMWVMDFEGNYNYYCVDDGNLPASVASLKLTVGKETAEQTVLKITSQPKNTYTKQGSTAKVTVAASGDGLTYQWYIKNAGATKYSKSSVTSSSYSVKMSASSKDRYVYCVVTDKYGKSVKSETVVMRMAATITTQPKSVVVAKGETAKVTFKAVGDGLKYTWYYKNAGDDDYTRTNTFTGNTYTISSMDASRHGRKVLCKVTDKYGKTVKTNSVTISMEAAITQQPKTSYAKLGKTNKITIKAVGDGLKYEWYFKNPGATKFSKTSTFTGNTYHIASMDAKRNGRQVYCKVTDKYGNTVKSNTVTLRLAASVVTQPYNLVVAKGERAKITFKAAGDGLKYEWYYKNPGATKFSKTTTFTGNTYTISSMTAARSGRQVYCKVTDKYGNTVKTNTVTIRMG